MPGSDYITDNFFVLNDCHHVRFNHHSAGNPYFPCFGWVAGQTTHMTPIDHGTSQFPIRSSDVIGEAGDAVVLCTKKEKRRRKHLGTCRLAHYTSKLG